MIDEKFYDVPSYRDRSTNCNHCGKQLAEQEPVWRRTITKKYEGSDTPMLGRPWHRYYSVPVMVCLDCLSHKREEGRKNWISGLPVGTYDFLCKRCSRPVYMERNAMSTKYCSELCKDKNRGDGWWKPDTPDSKACARCGEHFKPKRSTAEYCSGKCRVADHRWKHL